MNNKYHYIDGKVIIESDNEETRQEKYYDNIEKVLIQENVIEKMENDIKELEKQSKNYPTTKKRFFPIGLSAAITAIATMPLLVILLYGKDAFNTIETIYGSTQLILFNEFLIGPIVLIIGAAITMFEYIARKNFIKTGQGINSSLEFLKKQLDIEKDYLEELKKEKTNDNENVNFRTVKINDKERFAKINNASNLYFDLGYNLQKNYEAYQQGKIKEIYPNLTDCGIEFVSQYLEENGPKLSKKKKGKKEKYE